MMATQIKLDQTYLEMAKNWSNLSQANRMKVGCLIVKNGQIISDGFNGTPTGQSNMCEDRNGDTRREVLHAESNAITKLAKGTSSSEGATLYTTLSPCFECAKLIVQSGIRRVVCGELYRLDEGVDFLKTCGITVCIVGNTSASNGTCSCADPYERLTVEGSSPL
jgi:dCMP deaminase